METTLLKIKDVINNKFNVKDYAMLLSLIPPEEEAKKYYSNCGCSRKGVESPTLIELNLASRKHRWKDFNKLVNDFFKDIANTIEKYEIDVLKNFKLPQYEKILANIAGEEFDDDKKFKLDRNMLNSYKRIVSQMQKEIIGDDQLLDVEKLKQLQPSLADMALYQFYMLSFYSLSQNHVLQEVIDNLPENMSEEEIMNIVIPQLSNQYLINIIRHGAERIKTDLALNNIKEVLQELVDMARQGKSVYDVGRFLHKKFGGRLWYWMRITRSEPVLALNEAYRQVGKLAGVKYSKWSAMAGACPICSALDGHIWRFDRSPEPVASTHPHCFCILIPLFETKQPVQNDWNRASPYESPYSPEEIGNNFNLIPPLNPLD